MIGVVNGDCPFVAFATIYQRRPNDGATKSLKEQQRSTKGTAKEY